MSQTTRAIDLDPKYHFAHTGKADALRKWGGKHVKEALAIYEWVLQEPEASRSSRFAAYRGEGKLLLERSRSRTFSERKVDLEKAISMFNEALKLNPDDEEVKVDFAKAKARPGAPSK